MKKQESGVDLAMTIEKIKEKFSEELKVAAMAHIKARRYSKKFRLAIVGLNRKGMTIEAIRNEFKLSATAIFVWGKKHKGNRRYSQDIETNKRPSDFIELKVTGSGEKKNGKDSGSRPMSIVTALDTSLPGNVRRTMLDTDKTIDSRGGYTLISPSGYRVNVLSQGELVSLIHSLESSNFQSGPITCS